MDKLSKELKYIFDKLKSATFSGIATGKYYPPQSDTAYYRMSYTPGRMVLRHKSPSHPVEERLEFAYCENNYGNCAAIQVYDGKKLHKSYSGKQEFEQAFSDFEGRLLPVYLLKDPRFTLVCTERAGEIAPGNGFDRAYQVIPYTYPAFILGTIVTVVVKAEFFLKGNVLKTMRLRYFYGKKEIAPQTMDVAFQFNRRAPRSAKTIR